MHLGIGQGDKQNKQKLKNIRKVLFCVPILWLVHYVEWNTETCKVYTKVLRLWLKVFHVLCEQLKILNEKAVVCKGFEFA